MSKKNTKNKTSRRNFLKGSLAAGASAAAGAGILSVFANNKEAELGEKVKLLSPEGELVEVDKSHVKSHECKPLSPEQSRIGIKGRKFVMVIDLARCKNAGKCVDACQKNHHTSPEHPWIKVLKIQDSEKASPYWMPKPCFHCEKPPCVKVCPTQATFKRSDGIVLIDTEMCMGCRYCMVACPYSARVFNWKESEEIPGEVLKQTYSPETSVPSKVGTVGKCDFCPDMIRIGKLPHCVKACPMGVIYFGDENEDIVTNGEETVRFSELIKEKSGYRYKEGLNTKPSVYYLPPRDRDFPFEDETENKKV